jgi:hypothetical protein
VVTKVARALGLEMKSKWPFRRNVYQATARKRQHLSGSGQLTCLGIGISTDAENNLEIPPSFFEKVQLLEASSSIYHECAPQVTTRLQARSLTFHKDYSRAPPKNLRDLDRDAG